MKNENLLLSFEICKKLKEKGFNLECAFFWMPNFKESETNPLIEAPDYDREWRSWSGLDTGLTVIDDYIKLDIQNNYWSNPTSDNLDYYIRDWSNWNKIINPYLNEDDGEFRILFNPDTKKYEESNLGMFIGGECSVFELISRPYRDQAVMWLESKGFIINLLKTKGGWNYIIGECDSFDDALENSYEYSSREEATDKGIMYILEELL